MKEKDTAEPIDFGDIVVVDYPDWINQCTEKSRFGLVYAVRNFGVHMLPVTQEEGSDISCSIRIANCDLLEGSLPQECFILPDRMLLVKKKSVDRKVGRINTKKIDELLRKMAYDITAKHYYVVHKKPDFIPGQTYIPYAGRVYDAEEMKAIVDSGFDFWLTAGRFAEQFEVDFSAFLGVNYCILTNSGSSANLLAVSALTSPKLGHRQIKQGDEVITTACGFPTTVNPIVQNNLVPVFIDVDIGTYNIQANKIEGAISKKTKAIFIAHSLGNPFDLDKVMAIAEKHDLWVIEDNCDALGSKYGNRYTGSFGNIATFSFYPPHHITMGEGGALVTNDPQLKSLVKSFRDWGRDCWCESGHDNTCTKRFSMQLGTLPLGYDHKYIYSHIGYNLQITDMQAAVGVKQLKKLPSFLDSRKKNFRILFDGLKKYSKYFILPESMPKADPSWFGFPITVRKGAGFTRGDIVEYLEKNKIATRTLFAGNLIRHPSFKNVKYRVFGTLFNTDQVMNDTFWIGVYPGMSDKKLEYMVRTFIKFIDAYSTKSNRN